MGVSRKQRQTGVEFDWPADTPPAMAYVMDGSLKDIATDRALFAVLGTKYGGDGVATFGLPDGRERYRRGADAGKGAQPELVVGHVHADENKAHTHGITGLRDGDEAGISSGSGPAMGVWNSESSGGGEVRVKTLVCLPCIWR